MNDQKTTEPVSVGYGYFRIDPKIHGPKRATDEFFYMVDEAWCPIPLPFSDKFFSGHIYRRRIDPGEGWEIVPEGTPQTEDMDWTVNGIDWYPNCNTHWHNRVCSVADGGVCAYRRRLPATGRWFISCELPADKFTTEQSAVDEAKRRALEYGRKFTVFHATKALERIEPVPAQVREVQL